MLQDIAAAFKQIDRLFDTSSPHGAASTDLDSLISRICNHLALSVPLQRACSLCGSKTVEDGVLAGRNPITIASSCILFVTTLWGQRVDPKEISKVGGVQDSTIRTGYRYVAFSPSLSLRVVFFAPSPSPPPNSVWRQLLLRVSRHCICESPKLTLVTCASHRLLLTVKDRIVDDRWFDSSRPADQRADWANLAGRSHLLASAGTGGANGDQEVGGGGAEADTKSGIVDLT